MNALLVQFVCVFVYWIAEIIITKHIEIYNSCFYSIIVMTEQQMNVFLVQFVCCLVYGLVLRAIQCEYTRLYMYLVHCYCIDSNHSHDRC